MIDKRYWGLGLGTEAARGVRDYAFTQPDLLRLICTIDPENGPSAKVAMNIGMVFEKEGADELGPFWVYSMDRGQMVDI